MNKKDLGKAYNLFLKHKKKKRKCLYGKCSCFAINSHLLQKNGVVSQIAEEGYVYELDTNHNKFFGDIAKFKKVPINQAVSRVGFCNGHDSKLFKDIEEGQSESRDYSEVRQLLLFSYRANTIELRAKEILMGYYAEMVKKFPGYPVLELQRDSYRQGYYNHLNYQKLFEKHLNSNEYEFFFKKISIHKIEVATSVVITLDLQIDALNEGLQNPKKKDYFNAALFVSIVPNGQLTDIILGCHKHWKELGLTFMQQFEASTYEEKLAEISKIIIHGAELWCCSPSFYESNIRYREEEVVDEFNKTPTYCAFDDSLSPLNIFENE